MKSNLKTVLSILLFLSSSLCALPVVRSQDFPSLRDKAQQAVKTQRPDWKLKWKEEKHKEVAYQWGSKDDGVMLLIFYGASQQEAVERMKAALKILSVGPGKRLPNLGDEAYLSESARGSFAVIRFRKSNVYVDLVAPSAAMAKNLAKSLADEIQTK